MTSLGTSLARHFGNIGRDWSLAGLAAGSTMLAEVAQSVPVFSRAFPRRNN
jgi:hypothetical protein